MLFNAATINRANVTAVWANYWVTWTHIQVFLNLLMGIFKTTIEALFLTVSTGFLKVFG